MKSPIGTIIARIAISGLLALAIWRWWNYPAGWIAYGLTIAAALICVAIDAANLYSWILGAICFAIPAACFFLISPLHNSDFNAWSTFLEWAFTACSVFCLLQMFTHTPKKRVKIADMPRMLPAQRPLQDAMPPNRNPRRSLKKWVDPSDGYPTSQRMSDALPKSIQRDRSVRTSHTSDVMLQSTGHTPYVSQDELQELRNSDR